MKVSMQNYKIISFNYKSIVHIELLNLNNS